MQYGVMKCQACEQTWPEELPPLWMDSYPACPTCEGQAELLHKLVDLDVPHVMSPPIILTGAPVTPAVAKNRGRMKTVVTTAIGIGAVLASNASITRVILHAL